MRDTIAPKMCGRSPVFLVLAILVAQILAVPLKTRNSTLLTFPEITPSRDMIWYPCYDETLFCAILDVPLDYTSSTTERSYIPLIKYPATSKPYKGMVLFNFGGPGVLGTQKIAEQGAEMAGNIGANWDVVSWDPRGTGYSIPFFGCGYTATAATKKREFFELRGPNTPLATWEAYYSYVSQVSQICGSLDGAYNQAGPHLTTAVVARDMVSIVDAFASSADGKRASQDPTLVNYYGYSYGTFIGQVLASLFPNRIGAFLLDGVLDPDDWITAKGMKQVINTDEAFSTFFLYCNLAGPEQCKFHTGKTPWDIYNRFENIFVGLNTSDPTALSLLGNIRDICTAAAYHTWDFETLSDSLLAYETVSRNLTSSFSHEWTRKNKYRKGPWLGPTGGFTETNNPDNPYALPFIRCSDTGGYLYNKTVEDFSSDIWVLEKQSWLAGDAMVNWMITCSLKAIDNDEVFLGPFGGKTNNPILFVSNTLDPITPFVNAQKGTRIFKGSNLLTVEAIGHTSGSSRNKCAGTKILKFFQNSTLPGGDTSAYCPREAGPWNITLPPGSIQKRDDISLIGKALGNLRDAS